MRVGSGAQLVGLRPGQDDDAQPHEEGKLQDAGYKQKAEKWDTDSDSDEEDPEPWYRGIEANRGLIEASSRLASRLRRG